MTPDPTPLAARWDSGDAVPGVAFTRDAHVRILEGPFLDECARVRGLVSAGPDPCYRVEVDAAHVVLELAQSSLDRA